MWGQRSSGSGRADGGVVGPEGSIGVDRGLRFDAPVAPGGYRWWYIDALSDDGAYGLTIILFVGSVFSPYYKWQRRAGRSIPENHCAVNVVLFGKGGKRWTMTERGEVSLRRNADEIVIGPSRARATDGGLVIDLDELCVPWPFRVRGRVEVTFDALFDIGFQLDAAGRHTWRPIAPCAAIHVALTSPAQSWSGRAYVDSNWGVEPVEACFSGWQWSRAARGDEVCVYYDAEELSGARTSIACGFSSQGGVRALPQATMREAARTGWRMRRPYRSEEGGRGLIATVEDTPFYTRSLIGQMIEGQPVTAIHESLSVTRFASPLVQMMLPWRMPRRNSLPR